jgi:hypothetical protein
MVPKLGGVRQTSRKLRIPAWPTSAAFDIRERPVPECPICRQSYDGRFQVFVPPHDDAFDTVACARRAAEVRGWDTGAPVPIILPTIDSVHSRSEATTSVARRRRVAALAGFDLASGQAALATGVGLLAAGTAASIYLWARPGVTAPSSPIAAGAPTTGQTIGPRPAAPLTSGSPQTRPAADAFSRPQFAAYTGAGRSVGTASASSAETVIANAPSGAPLSTGLAEFPPASPTHAPKPPPSNPKAPSGPPKPPTSSPPSPASPPAPVNPAGPAEPAVSGGGNVTPAGNPPSQQPPPLSPPPPSSPPSSSPPPSPPPPSPPPSPSTEPVATTTTATEEPASTRPGKGLGDENHVHTGPPGQGNNGNGNGNGNGGGNGNGHSHDH